MKHPTVIYYVRHAENEANVANVFSHRIIDLEITGRGWQQARQLADYLAREPLGPGPIFASPLKRAIQTATPLAERLGRQIQVIEEFRELNVGALDGQSIDIHLESWWSVIEAWVHGKRHIRFPEGESHHELTERVRSGIAKILNSGFEGPHVLIAHAGLLRIGFTGLSDSSPDSRSSLPNCSITRIEVDQDSQGMIFVYTAKCEFLTEPTGTWRH